MAENGIEKFFVGKCGEYEIFFVTLQRNLKNKCLVSKKNNISNLRDNQLPVALTK